MLRQLSRHALRTAAVGAVLGAGALVASNLVQPRGNYEFVALTEDQNLALVGCSVAACELLDRLRTYRSFDAPIFDAVVRQTYLAVCVEQSVRDGDYDATPMRCAAHTFTELTLELVDGIRLLRARVGAHPDAGRHLPEFDAVASDVQSLINDLSHNVSFGAATWLDRHARK